MTAPGEVDYTDYALHPAAEFHRDRYGEGRGGRKVQRNSYYSAQIDSRCRQSQPSSQAFYWASNQNANDYRGRGTTGAKLCLAGRRLKKTLFETFTFNNGTVNPDYQERIRECSLIITESH